MKILVLNPHIDAGHKIVKALEKRGLAVLIASNLEEALQMLQLHGTSIDLAVVHREGVEAPGLPDTEPGLRFIAKVKAMPDQMDLPFIVSSTQWVDADCARHQQTPLGANAYLRWPFEEENLFQLIEAVMGNVPAAGGTQVGTMSVQLPSLPVSASKPESSLSGMILEDAAKVFKGGSEQTPSAFHLEAPVLENEPAPALTVSPPSSSPEAPKDGTIATRQVALPEFPSAPAGLELSPSISPPADGASGLIVITPDSPESAGEPMISANAPGIGLQGISIGGFSKDEPVISPAAERQDFRDPQAAQEMPYLYGQPGGSGTEAPSRVDPVYAFGQPVGDSVVPGGAAQAPDTETLKKYLLLREQDVAVLSTQLRTAHEQISALEETLRAERARAGELQHAVTRQGARIEDFEKEKAIALEGVEMELSDLRFQSKVKADKVRLLELQVREAAEETERLKERVRTDIRKIRVREKELENKLEIMKKDSEALISARENKIIELKRKVDLLEFNMDLLQDQYMREKETSAGLRERLAKAAQVLRVAGGVLEPAGAQGQSGPQSAAPGNPTASGGHSTGKREAS